MRENEFLKTRLGVLTNKIQSEDMTKIQNQNILLKSKVQELESWVEDLTH